MGRKYKILCYLKLKVEFCVLWVFLCLYFFEESNLREFK